MDLRQRQVGILLNDLRRTVRRAGSCRSPEAWPAPVDTRRCHDEAPSHGGERGIASLIGSRWHYPLETGTRPAIQSTTRSPIMITVA
jgi:hypothetical protein